MLRQSSLGRIDGPVWAERVDTTGRVSRKTIRYAAWPLRASTDRGRRGQIRRCFERHLSLTGISRPFVRGTARAHHRVQCVVCASMQVLAKLAEIRCGSGWSYSMPLVGRTKRKCLPRRGLLPYQAHHRFRNIKELVIGGLHISWLDSIGGCRGHSR